MITKPRKLIGRKHVETCTLNTSSLQEHLLENSCHYSLKVCKALCELLHKSLFIDNVGKNCIHVHAHMHIVIMQISLLFIP